MIQTLSGEEVKVIKKISDTHVLIQYDDGETQEYPIKNLRGYEEE